VAYFNHGYVGDMDNMDVSGIDILSLAQYTGVSIKKSGRLYAAICPFHNEKTPSLRLYPTTNSFYCFGCGLGGNGFVWVKNKFQYSDVQTFDWLEVYSPELKETIELARDMPPVNIPLISLEMVDYWYQNLMYTGQDNWFRLRGFTDETIKRERFGWDGERFVIPVWEGKPGQSKILTIRRRKIDKGKGPKYLTPRDTLINFVWGRWYVSNSSILIMFAGELDAALAVQDNLPANSLVGGQGSFRNFPRGWPSLWYPQIKYLLVVFDHKESAYGGLLAQSWADSKGSLSADVIHWLDDSDDFNQYRMSHSKDDFLDMLGCQSKLALQLRQF